MVYSDNDLRGVKAPELKFDDKKATKEFRASYLTYVTEHENKMRARPKDHRLLPKSVVECIDPDLLLYICQYKLDKKYRTSNPAQVSALAVHQWVMKHKKDKLDMEDSKWIKRLKGFKLALNCHEGV